MRIWIFVGLLLGAMSGLSGCGSESSTCGTSADCGEGQACEEGSCVTPSAVMCTGDPDCRPGFQCLGGSCQPLPRFDMGPEDMTPEPDFSEPDMPAEEDMAPLDNVNPTVVAITPADGTADVALDVSITVEFSEDMNPATVNFMSLLLKDPAGDDINAQVTFDPETNIATLTPDAPLYPATGYRVVPTALLRDLADNSLRIDPSPDANFTTILGIPEKHTELANTFAPVVFQSMESFEPGARNIDTPMLVNFDDDFEARNNKANGLLTTVSPPANVYYSVVESQTHYFITYALYYPVRRIKNTEVNQEHDFTGAVFVVDKATETLQMVEGLKVDEGNDTVIAFKPSSSQVTGTGNSSYFETIQEADYVEGRYPLFITSGSHEACHWVNEGPTVPTVCRHDSRGFSEGPTDGVMMRPGTAQIYNESVENTETGIREMEYGLVPLASLWATRNLVGEQLLWEKLTVYSPIEGRTSKYPDESLIVWPNRLFSNDETTYGKPPFAWLKTSSNNNQGQWLFDPAYLLQVRYAFPEGFSADYCHNVYMAIDNTSSAPCAEVVE